MPGRLSGRESFRAGLPDLLEDLLSTVASLEGVSKTFDWINAVGNARTDYENAFDDDDRPRFAPASSAPVRRPGAKLGRNDPCPCGSGKKYKRCCLAEHEAATAQAEVRLKNSEIDELQKSLLQLEYNPSAIGRHHAVGGGAGLVGSVLGGGGGLGGSLGMGGGGGNLHLGASSGALGAGGGGGGGSGGAAAAAALTVSGVSAAAAVSGAVGWRLLR